MQENKIIIENKLLKEIDYSVTFFDSLRNDYYNFNNWFINKQNNNYKAYITYNNDNKISSFLLLKIENEYESYIDFDKSLNPLKRLKICTMKVDNINKNIGKSFIKIINSISLENNIKEIYITIYPKYTKLIQFLEKYDYKYYTDKITKNGQGNLVKEKVYVKQIKE